MRTPTPTRLGSTPCDGSTLECFARGMAVVAVVPLALWALSAPAVAVVAAGIAAVAFVTVVVAGSEEARFSGER